MKTFFDSSTLLAVLLQSEIGHEAAAAAFDSAQTRLASSHSMAECFAQLTGKLRIPPAEAAELIQEGFPGLEWVTLPPKNAVAVIEEASTLGIRGGLIYDAMILAAARHARADVILTGNSSDFLICAPDLAERIREP